MILSESTDQIRCSLSSERVIKLPWILLMQTVWTFLVYFWLLRGLRTPPDPSCVRACSSNPCNPHNVSSHQSFHYWLLVASA